MNIFVNELRKPCTSGLKKNWLDTGGNIQVFVVFVYRWLSVFDTINLKSPIWAPALMNVGRVWGEKYNPVFSVYIIVSGPNTRRLDVWWKPAERWTIPVQKAFLLYKLSISPQCKYCGSVIIISSPLPPAQPCWYFTHNTGERPSSANECSQWMIVFT